MYIQSTLGILRRYLFSKNSTVDHTSTLTFTVTPDIWAIANYSTQITLEQYPYGQESDTNDTAVDSNRPTNSLKLRRN